MNYNIDVNQTWQTAKFIIVHMIQYELFLVFLVTGAGAWHLSNMLSKHNDRQRDATFSRRISWACLLLMIVFFALRQFLQ